ncbi:MAG: hypothetical protein COA52_15120 [Hyphomicrobiales bacterium]|nr:ATP-binding protein [Hyphomicrobiales bacterium]PCJ86366.1 MAG: hypothetical protein COA52_15120 [Hyphomicrobiales bacterium]
MTYFRPKTATDIIHMRERGDTEGPALEFKSSKLLKGKMDKAFDSLSKELTAFANSMGGVLIIGIEDENNGHIADIIPLTDTKMNEQRLEDGLLPRISPPLSMNIYRIEITGGFLMVFDVPASANGPHQANDKRFYARRLLRIDPLLPFEIDDIRRRTMENPVNVSLTISFRDQGINFSIINNGFASIHDIFIEVKDVPNSSIAQTWSPALERPYTEPFKVIQPAETRHFPGTAFEFFKERLNDKMEIVLNFSEQNGIQHKQNYVYSLKDFESASSTKKTTSEILLERELKVLEGTQQVLRELSNTMKAIQESSVHSSGLNLSNTTLKALTGQENWKWSGQNMSFSALAEVLEIDVATAVEVQRELFGEYVFAGGTNRPLEETIFTDELKQKILDQIILPHSS